MYIDHAFKERREVLIQRIGVIKKRMAPGGRFGGRGEGNKEGTKEEMSPHYPHPLQRGAVITTDEPTVRSYYKVIIIYTEAYSWCMLFEV